MASRYWLCFDVGLTSSFEQLYGWLDDHKAIECGDNTATFFHDKPFDAVAKELTSAVRRDNGHGTRLYLIGPVQGRGYVGKFITGRRKASPWQGFGSAPSDERDEA